MEVLKQLMGALPVVRGHTEGRQEGRDEGEEFVAVEGAESSSWR